jgi:glutamate 5-kinase
MTDAAPVERAARAALARCRRVVVKVGSRSLAQRAQGSAPSGDAILQQLADDLGELGPVGRGKKKGRRDVVLVSSGAIAFGVQQLGLRRRPREMASLQAAAAAGQGELMQRWGHAFERHGLPVAQVLLTHSDLANRTRANNAQRALLKLLELGAVPVINENDAVAVDEIRFGDNDELAAMVAPLCEADLLLLLSHVDGLLDHRDRRVPLVERVEDAKRWVRDETSTLGTGGMVSKLEAARRATLGGVHVVIAPASEPQVVRRILAGESLGTLFPAVAQRLSARKHWIAYTLRPLGAALVDAGAADAIRHGGRSVLCVGVVGVRGAFVSGDPIRIIDPHGEEIARGIARLSAGDAARLAGSAERSMLVHRNDLVVLPRV